MVHLDGHPRGRAQGDPGRARAQLRFAVERFDDCIDEGMALLQRHWEEITEDKDLNVLDLDREFYRTMEKMGRLLIVTVRDRASGHLLDVADPSFKGALVGYVSLFVNRNPHYRSCIVAVNDVHFLLPAYRHGTTGYRMLRCALDQAKARGARLATLRTKDRHHHGRLLERLGGRLLDHVYVFRL